MGQLPSGWKKSKLGEIVESAKGKVPKAFSEAPAEGFAPYVDIEAFEQNEVRRYATLANTTPVTSSDVIIVWDGARFGLSGVHQGGILGSTLVKMQSEILERDLLLQFLKMHFKSINARPRGTGTPHIEPDVLWNLEVGIPPLNEQRRIVEKLEALFVQLDKGQQAVQEVQKLLKRYRRSVLKSAVTGTLTADWRAERESELECGANLVAQILKSRRENWKGRGKFKDPIEPDTSSLSELPKGWVWARMEQLFDVLGGATPSRREPDNWCGDIPWVSSGEVAFCRISATREQITQAGYDSCSTKLHPVGTVLLAMIGEGKTRGQAAILDIPACNNQNACAIRVSETPIPPEYIYYYLLKTYEENRLKGQGGNQPALSGAKVKNFVVPVCSPEEMGEICNRLEVEFSRIEKTEAWCETELKRSAALRQSILKDAFSGCLVPQDPDDEPISALLERIKAARAVEPKKTSRKKRA